MCSNCGFLTDHPNACGRCGKRFSMVANPHYDPVTAEVLASAAVGEKKKGELKQLSDILSSAYELPRTKTGVEFFDRLIGGGLVLGKAYLIAGGPGTGKSTLLMQVLAGLAAQKLSCLYVSGEEDENQIASRANRVLEPPKPSKKKRKKAAVEEEAEESLIDEDSPANYISLWSTRDTGEAAGAIRAAAPKLVIVDSIQEIGNEELETAFGGHKQVDDLMRLCIEEAKKVNAAIIFVCQVTKNGDPAGPKRAEHLTDCNMKIDAVDAEDISFDDDPEEDEEDARRRRRRRKKDDDVNPAEREYRFVTCWKNRFAPANTQAVLRMTARGLIEAKNRDD